NESSSPMRIRLDPPLELELGLRHDDTLVSPAVPRLGEPVTVSLWGRADVGLRSVELRCAPDGEEELHAMRAVERAGRPPRRGAPTRGRRFGELPLPYADGKNLDFYGGDLLGVERRLPHLERLGVSGVFLNPIWPALSNHRYDLIDHGRVDPHLGGDPALASL